MAVNGIYAKFFGNHKPARSAVEVARLPKDVLVEVEAIVRYVVDVICFGVLSAQSAILIA